MYTPVKTYQQNFVGENSTADDLFYFKPLTKTKETNKWKIVCTNIIIETIGAEFYPKTVLMKNCPMLSGFGNTIDNSTSIDDNRILLGGESVSYTVAGDPLAVTGTSVKDIVLPKTEFIVKEIKQDPFAISIETFGETGQTYGGCLSWITFEITELELV